MAKYFKKAKKKKKPQKTKNTIKLKTNLPKQIQEKNNQRLKAVTELKHENCFTFSNEGRRFVGYDT